MEYRIDGTKMLTRQAAHDELARALRLPDYYGRNLDALWDMLTSMSGEAVMTDASVMLNALGSYGERLLGTFFEAAEKNPGLVFRKEG